MWHWINADEIIFLKLNLDIRLVFSKNSNGNFLFSKYFSKSIYRLMFVLDLPPGNEQVTTFLKKFFDPNKIDYVLPRCIESLLSTSRLLKAQSSFPSVSWMTLTCFPETNKAESSAYKMSLHFTADSMSLTYKQWTHNGTLWYTTGHPGFGKGTIYIHFLGSIR